MKSPGELDGLVRGLTRESSMGWDGKFVDDLRFGFRSNKNPLLGYHAKRPQHPNQLKATVM